MSRYDVNKVLWDVYRDGELAGQFTRDALAVLDGRLLTDEERRAVAGRDLRRLVELGAHPFLVYNFALRLNGSFSIPFVVDYVRQLGGLTVGDITT